LEGLERGLCKTDYKNRLALDRQTGLQKNKIYILKCCKLCTLSCFICVIEKMFNGLCPDNQQSAVVVFAFF